jgi:hypothetical protein
MRLAHCRLEADTAAAKSALGLYGIGTVCYNP